MTYIENRFEGMTTVTWFGMGEGKFAEEFVNAQTLEDVMSVEEKAQEPCLAALVYVAERQVGVFSKSINNSWRRDLFVPTADLSSSLTNAESRHGKDFLLIVGVRDGEAFRPFFFLFLLPENLPSVPVELKF
ncbi:MAG TPA: hypothetical protein VGO47_02055 [Chlamydiales bacterium]|nr:hypothetical protein [Chlamydiales bacterium]